MTNTHSEPASMFYKARSSQLENQGKKTGNLSVLHLTGITKEGGLMFTQGFSDMPGVIKKEAIDLYYPRFNFYSKEEITKHLEKNK